LEEPAAVSLGQLIRHIAADVLAGVATLSGSFAVVLVVARLSGRFDLVAMYGIVNAAQAVLSGDLRLPVLATVILCGALVVAIITNGLVYRRSGKPRRTRPGVRQLLTSIGLAALAGIGVSVLFGAVFMLVGLDEDFDPRVGIILAIGLSLFLSTALGLGRWLAGTDDAHQHSVSPDSVLSGDRAALLITMVCSLIVGTGVALLAIAQTTIGSRQTLWLSGLDR